LAQVIISKLGNTKTKLRLIGIRPGEKMFESLVSTYEAPRTYNFGKYFVISPSIPIAKYEDIYQKRYVKLKKVNFTSYTSEATEQLNLRSIEKLLIEDGWFEKSPQQDAIKQIEELAPEKVKNYFRTEGWVLPKRNDSEAV